MKIFAFRILVAIYLISIPFIGFSNRKSIDSLEQILKANPTDSVLINTLIQLAIDYRSEDVKKAIIYADSALALSKKINYADGLAKSYNRLGSLYLQQGYYLLAFENYHKAMVLFDSLQNKQGLSHCLNGLGVIYRQQKNYENAISFSKKALNLNKQRKDTVGLAINYNNIGLHYFEMGDLEAARQYADSSLQLWTKLKDTARMANPLQTLGKIYFALHLFDKSVQAYNQALYFSEKKNNKYYTSFALIGIADALVKMNQLSKAENTYIQALKICEELGLKDNIKNIYAGLSELNYNAGKFKEAYLYQKRFLHLKDSLYNEEISNRISEIESLHTLRSKETHILSLKQTAEYQQKIINRERFIKIGLIIVLLLFIIIGIYFARLNIQKTKINKELLIQHEEIMQQSQEIIEKNAELQQQQEEIESQNNALYTINEKLEQINKELELTSIAASKTDSAIIITDADTRFIWVNDGFTKLYGFEKDEFIEQYVSLTQSSLLPNINELIRECIHGKKSAIYESIDYTKSGKKLIIQTVLTPIFNTDGILDKWVIVDTDITKLKETEKELENLNKNLEIKIQEEIQKNRDKDFMLAQQSRLAAMGEMIGNIAHQWRQPLNAVGVIIQNIQEANEYNELTTEYLAKRVEKAMDLIQYMSQTINDFRNFFKPEKEKQYFDLNRIIEKAIGFIDAHFKNLSIALKINLQDDIMVYGYPNEYAQVIINILNNAKDVFLERQIKSPLITIESCREKDLAVVRISDNAGGIATEIMNKIFDPYFTTKSHDKGTGLGLYMSKTIIERNMGGKISVQNIENGAMFSIALPYQPN